MGFMGKKSILKSEIIKKVILNKKDYKYLDFYFKIVPGRLEGNFNLEVYNFESHILSLDVTEETWGKNKDKDGRFGFEVIYFNPQTDNDCFSINHIIACLSDLAVEEEKRKDYGNADVFNNEFVLRRKRHYYDYTMIWKRGEVNKENYNQMFSYEFATNEYVRYIKGIFGFKRMPRRELKKQFQQILDKKILVQSLTK